MKVCKCCKKMKRPEQFYSSKRTHDGLTVWCRSCLLLKNRSPILVKKNVVETKTTSAKSVFLIILIAVLVMYSIYSLVLQLT